MAFKPLAPPPAMPGPAVPSKPPTAPKLVGAQPKAPGQAPKGAPPPLKPARGGNDTRPPMHQAPRNHTEFHALGAPRKGEKY